MSIRSTTDTDKEAKRSLTDPRIVCGAVVIDENRTKVLLISSRKHLGKWVLPKGGYEVSDEKLESAAYREAYEEAGVIGTISSLILITDDKRPIKNLTVNDKFIPRARYHFYEILVQKLEPDWPEKKERERKWFNFDEALSLVSWRSEQAEAVKMILDKQRI